MIIEEFDVHDITPDPANVRKHSQENIEAIMNSLKVFGQQTPIVINSKKIVLKGNGTYEAARRLGWDKIKARVTELDGIDAVMYAIADNRTAELAEWDIVSLQRVLSELRNVDADLSTLGWSDVELSGLFPESDLDLSEFEGDDSEGSAGEAGKDPEVSHVRMVQLFFNDDNIMEFQEFVRKLGETYGLETATDVVLEAMRRENNRLQG